MHKEKVLRMSHERFFIIRNAKGIYVLEFFLDVKF
jgi:hypothetical protein